MYALDAQHRRTLLVLAISFVLGFFFVKAFGQEVKPFKVAEGSVSGTYGAMFAEIQEACSTPQLPLEKIDGVTDAVSNLNAVVNSQANAGFVRSDVIFFRGMGEDLSSIKTLFSLWPEEVHIVALKTTSVTKPGKYFGSNVTQVELQSFGDLNGMKIGAAGGNVITGQVLCSQAGVQCEIVQFDDGKQVFAALDSGAVQAAVFTAGQPLANISGLSAANHKLLPILDIHAEKLKGVYRPARLYYPKLATGSIPTVAADALFVTRTYRTQEKIRQLGELRQCFYTKLDELKDNGRNPKWQQVDSNNPGKWAWYELPSATQQASQVQPQNTASSRVKKK
jgi:TRAP-type uncharacterized transport system substrate-binding protein